mgnify:CR=1 FL=1
MENLLLALRQDQQLTEIELEPLDTTGTAALAARESAPAGSGASACPAAGQQQ